MTENSEIYATISKLERSAAHILEKKARSLPKRPIIIEFCGSPKSGKSTCIASLEIFLKRNGFKVKTVFERAGICPVSDKYSPEFNIWTATQSLSRLVELLDNKFSDVDIIILDRGLYDACIWFYWQRKNMHLDETHYRIFQDFLLCPRWVNKVDLVYIFKANPDTLLNREYRNLLTRKFGSVMRPDVLESLNDSIEEFYESIGQKRFRAIKQLDTSALDPNQVSLAVTETVLSVLEERLTEQVGYFKRSDIEKIGRSHFPLGELLELNPHLKFGPRPEIEEKEEFVQPVATAAVIDAEQDRVLVGRKRKSSVSSSSAEVDRSLLYFGGHVRAEDRYDESAKLEDVLKWAVTRELKEELGVSLNPASASSAICVWDRSSPKSAKHLGIIFPIRTSFERLKFKTDANEFSDARISDVGTSFLKRKDSQKLEAWSRAILEHFLQWDKRLPGID